MCLSASTLFSSFKLPVQQLRQPASVQLSGPSKLHVWHSCCCCSSKPGQQTVRAATHQADVSTPDKPCLGLPVGVLTAAYCSTFGVPPTAAAAAAVAAAAEGIVPVDPSTYVPGPIEVGWQIWFAAIVSTIPFVIGAYEFGKRILIQRRCQVCGGSGLVSKGRFQRKCPQCGGFFPWISWSMFLSANARPGNGGPLLQPRGQTSVLYTVPPPPGSTQQAQQQQQDGSDSFKLPMLDLQEQQQQQREAGASNASPDDQFGKEA